MKLQMTKLEQFVWNNPHATFEQIATQLNRSVQSVEQAYSRASAKDKHNKQQARLASNNPNATAEHLAKTSLHY